MNDLRKYVTLMENIVSGGDIIEDKTVSVTVPTGKSPEDTTIEDMKLSKFNTYIGATPENIRELIFNDLNDDGLALNENDWAYIDADKNEVRQGDDFSIDIFMIRDGKVIPQAVNTTFEDFKNWEMTSDYPEDYFELVHKELARTGNYVNEEGWLSAGVVDDSSENDEELMNSEHHESINENTHYTTEYNGRKYKFDHLNDYNLWLDGTRYAEWSNNEQLTKELFSTLTTLGLMEEIKGN